MINTEFRTDGYSSRRKKKGDIVGKGYTRGSYCFVDVYFLKLGDKYTTLLSV